MKVAHAPGSETSRESAAQLEPHIGHIDLVVLRALRTAPDGLTRFEIAEHSDLLVSTVCGSVDRLKKAGKATLRPDPQTGKKVTRLSPSHRNVEVIYAVDAIKKLTPEQQVRLLDTEPKSYGATDIAAMNNRVTMLDALYHLDGRHLKSHPNHGVYTGLAQALAD